MTAAELAALIASRFPSEQGLFGYRCQTGDPYVVLGFEDWTRESVVDNPATLGPLIPGVIRDFAPRRHYETEAEACEDMVKAFDLYQAHTTHGGGEYRLFWRYADGHIFWHDKETWRGHGKNRVPLGALKCRLVITNSPVVNASQDDYDARRMKEIEQQILEGVSDGQG